MPTASAPVSLAAPEEQSDTKFEIGLVMAGAISAGAYTAGVVDFLFKALDAWYNPQRLASDGWGGPTPPHDVKLKTMAGASAGGMCAALTAVSILDGDTSRFHNAWVNQIDIRPLLQPNGPQQPPVTSLKDMRSVLNCDVLDQIANQAITLPTGSPKWPAWLDSQLDFYLTLTNLNGLVYEVTQQGGAPQRFIDHADRIQYRLLKPGAPVPLPSDPALRMLPATPQTPQQQQVWDELKTAALATGAFPVALLNRRLLFDNEYFNNRSWWYGAQAWPAHVQRTGQLDPNRKPVPDPLPAPYLFVDGGVTNNEPLELVRRTLVGDASGLTTSVTQGDKARQAALMIDPFPANTSEDGYTEMQQELSHVVPAIYTALRNQSRYRTEDLLGALDLDESSRFLISPVRTTAASGSQPATPSLASGTLGAFGGFLHRPFREHDYQLGRRNCQQFLREWFTLPATNGLFQNWPDEKKALARPRPGNPTGPVYLPIIPLLGADIQAELPSPSWDAARLPVDTLENEIAPLLEQRIGWFTNLVKKDLPGGWWWLNTGYSWFIQPKLRRLALNTVMKKVRRGLNDAGLLVPRQTEAQLKARAG